MCRSLRPTRTPMCHQQREERQELARPRRRPTLCRSDRLTPRNTISWTWSWSMAFCRWVAVGRQEETGPDHFANIQHYLPADRGPGVSSLFRSRNSSQCVSIFYTNNQTRHLEARRHGVCGWVLRFPKPKLKWMGRGRQFVFIFRIHRTNERERFE